MADYFDSLKEKHKKFINKQMLFTVASAPTNDGHVNVSPKGMDSFRIIDDNTVCYLDFIGSGNETAAHMLENGRITIMFMSFDRNPQIMRLYGNGEALQKNTDGYKKLIGLFPDAPGIRQIFKIKVNSVVTSCGYMVPTMENASERDTLTKWHMAKGEDALKDYQREKNLKSIDGLDTGLVVED